MPKLTVIGSSSHGNSYVLECCGQKLIIEIGLSWKKIMGAINFDISGLVGVISTHVHGDHFNANTFKNCQLNGIRVSSTFECATKYEGVGAFLDRGKYNIGRFKVMALSVPHNAECFAYVIDMPEDNGRLLFITDASDFPYKIPKVNYLCIETNYCEDKLIDNLMGDGVSSQPTNHMSLDTALAVTERLYSPSLCEVVCLHLSDGNSDENEIKKRFFETLGIRAKIAQPGLIINLEKEEF
jgi:phosphoribosyl 1,2-cyclic phosphodiesterase